MVAACILASGLLGLGLSVLLLRRLISPQRFAQIVGGLALGLAVSSGLAGTLGGRP